MKYSLKKGVLKSVVSLVLVGLPLVFQLLPTEWMNLTLGGFAVLLLNYVKIKTAKL